MTRKARRYSRLLVVILFLFIAMLIFSFFARLNNEQRCADEGGTYLPNAEVCVKDDTVIFENPWE